MVSGGNGGGDGWHRVVMKVVMGGDVRVVGSDRWR